MPVGEPRKQRKVWKSTAGRRMIAAEGAEPLESDVASTATKERNGDTPLGCSG
jgi:hypothetical protein